MKMKIIALSGLMAAATLISACGAVTVTTNSTNTANANKPATNANATTNSTNTNSNASNSSAANTNKDTKDSASTTSGDSVSMDSAGIKMTLPKGFTVEKEGDELMMVTTPDKGFTVIFQAVDGKDFAAATKDMAAVLDKGMKDVKVEEKDKKGEVNGMETISSGGTGVDKETGKPVVWKMAALNAPKKPVLATAIGDADSIEKHGKEIGALLDSVKKQ